MDAKTYRVAKLAADLKDTYINLLSEGYSPKDLEQFTKDVQKDPSKVKTPTPTGGNTSIGAQDPSTFDPSTLSKTAEEDLDLDEVDMDEGPAEDDYIVSDTGSLRGKTQVSQYGKVLFTTTEEEAAMNFIQKHMEKNNFFPGIWKQDDHGGMSRISSDKEAISEEDVAYLSGNAFGNQTLAKKAAEKVTIKKTEYGEYRVPGPAGKEEKAAYYTTDKQDAIDTAKKMHPGKEIFCNNKKVASDSHSETKQDMVNFLKGRWANTGVDGLEDEIEVALYYFARDYHSGQSSDLYKILSTSDYTPGPNSTLESEGDIAQDLYQDLVEEYEEESGE